MRKKLNLVLEFLSKTATVLNIVAEAGKKVMSLSEK